MVTKGVPTIVTDVQFGGEYLSIAFIPTDAFLVPITLKESRTIEGGIAAVKREWQRKLRADYPATAHGMKETTR